MNRKEKLEQYGHTIMKHIAALVDPDHRGQYQNDPDVKRWDVEWGWKHYLGDERIPEILIDRDKMNNTDVPVEKIHHRSLREVIRSIFRGEGEI